MTRKPKATRVPAYGRKSTAACLRLPPAATSRPAALRHSKVLLGIRCSIHCVAIPGSEVQLLRKVQCAQAPCSADCQKRLQVLLQPVIDLHQRYRRSVLFNEGTSAPALGLLGLKITFRFRIASARSSTSNARCGTLFTRSRYGAPSHSFAAECRTVVLVIAYRDLQMR
jgi:hypothetical protein